MVHLIDCSGKVPPEIQPCYKDCKWDCYSRHNAPGSVSELCLTTQEQYRHQFQHPPKTIQLRRGSRASNPSNSLPGEFRLKGRN